MVSNGDQKLNAWSKAADPFATELYMAGCLCTPEIAKPAASKVRVAIATVSDVACENVFSISQAFRLQGRVLQFLGHTTTIAIDFTWICFGTYSELITVGRRGGSRALGGGHSHVEAEGDVITEFGPGGVGADFDGFELEAHCGGGRPSQCGRGDSCGARNSKWAECPDPGTLKRNDGRRWRVRSRQLRAKVCRKKKSFRTPLPRGAEGQ